MAAREDAWPIVFANFSHEHFFPEGDECPSAGYAELLRCTKVCKHWRKSALEAVPRLKRLVFDFFPYGPHELSETEAMAVVAQALSQMGESLEVLDLRPLKDLQWGTEEISQRGAKQLLAAMPPEILAKFKGLRELKPCLMPRKFYGDFFARIKTLTSLEVLNLEGMRMPAQQSLQMASVLSCFPHLRSLNLACNFIGDRDSPDGGRVSKALAKALKKLTALEELDMSDSDIRDGDIRLLAQGLQQKTSLVHLNLTGDDSEQYYTAHWFGSKGCKALGSMLKTLSSLKTLRLSYCNIDKSNIEELGAGIAQLTLLEMVDFGGNKLGNEGATCLAAALNASPVLSSLKELKLGGNNIDELGRQAVSDAFDDAALEVLYSESAGQSQCIVS